MSAHRRPPLVGSFHARDDERAPLTISTTLAHVVLVLVSARFYIMYLHCVGGGGGGSLLKHSCNAGCANGQIRYSESCVCDGRGSVGAGPHWIIVPFDDNASVNM